LCPRGSFRVRVVLYACQDGHVSLNARAVLHGDAVRNSLGGAEALQYWKMKDALEVQVIFDLVLDGCFFCQMLVR
jgi:hypothetical protein